MTSSPLIKPERQGENASNALSEVPTSRRENTNENGTTGDEGLLADLELWPPRSQSEAPKFGARLRDLTEHNGESRRIGIRETESELSRPPRAHVGRDRLFNVG